MARSKKPVLALIVALGAGSGCRPPYLKLSQVPLPSEGHPALETVVLARRAVLVAEQSQYEGGQVVYVRVAPFPAEVTVHGQITAQPWRGPERCPGEIAATARRFDGRSDVVVTWRGRLPAPDRLEVRIPELCLGGQCEEVTVTVPISAPAPRP